MGKNGSFWSEYINDNVVTIPGFNIICGDRKQHQHGGVCMYINKTIKCEILDELSDERLEVVYCVLMGFSGGCRALLLLMFTTHRLNAALQMRRC